MFYMFMKLIKIFFIGKCFGEHLNFESFSSPNKFYSRPTKILSRELIHTRFCFYIFISVQLPTHYLTINTDLSNYKFVLELVYIMAGQQPI